MTDGRRPAFPHLPEDAWRLHGEDALEGEARARVERHLDECSACRRLLEAWDPSRLFRRLRCLEVRPAVWEGFWDDVRADLAPLPGPATTPRPGRWVAAGAAAALIAMVALHVMGPVAEQGDRPATRARLGASKQPAGSTALPEDAPCPAAVTALRLTREECAVLFGTARPEGAVEVVLSESLDLRGL